MQQRLFHRIQNRKLRPNCYLINHRIRLDDIVISVEHPKANFGGLPT
jgi:hypothetical protein